MSASDHFGPQLQMFIPAHVLSSGEAIHHADLGEGTVGPEDLADLRNMKVKEAHFSDVRTNERSVEPGQPSFYDSVKAEGVKQPVEMSVHPYEKPVLLGGHHRAFVANDVSPSAEVPVTYQGQSGYWSYADARRARQAQRQKQP